jgi:hypothetical protein
MMHSRLANHTLFAAVLALLSSCANIPSDFRFDPSKDEGLIVGSITYESALGLYSLIVVGESGAAAAAHPMINVGYSMYPALGPTYDDALKAKGGTFAVTVPAGSYRIVGWRAKQGYKVSGPSRRFEIPFVVERGKASYVGNLNFSPDWEVSIRDRSERDLPALNAKYSALVTAPLAYTIAKYTDLKNVGGEYQSTMEMPSMPIFVPVKR